MVNKKISYSGVVVLSLCPVIPATTRLGYGIYLAVGILWIFFFSVISRFLSKQMRVESISTLVEAVIVLSSVILYEQIASFFMPVVVNTLSLFLYLEAFISILMMTVCTREYGVSRNGSFREVFLEYFFVAFRFIIFILLFSLVRELVGFGTFSVPNTTGIYVIQLIPGVSASLFRYLVSTGGGLLLAGVSICLSRVFTGKLASYEGDL